MIGILVLILIATFLLVSAILMIYDPVIYLSKLNAIYRWLMRGHPWFQYSLEPVRAGHGRFSMRVAGVAFLLGAIIMFHGAVMSLGRWLGNHETTNVERVRSALSGEPSLLGRAFLVPFILGGALLAISPRRTLSVLCMDRWMAVRPPEWGWRVVGAGLAVLCLAAFFS